MIKRFLKYESSFVKKSNQLELRVSKTKCQGMWQEESRYPGGLIISILSSHLWFGLKHVFASKEK